MGFPQRCAKAAVIVPRPSCRCRAWRRSSAVGRARHGLRVAPSALAHAPRFYDRATADAMFDEISQYAGLNFTPYLIERGYPQPAAHDVVCRFGVGEYRSRRTTCPGCRLPPRSPRRGGSKRPWAPVQRRAHQPRGRHRIRRRHADDNWLGRDFDVPASPARARPFGPGRGQTQDDRDARPWLAARDEGAA